MWYIQSSAGVLVDHLVRPVSARVVSAPTCPARSRAVSPWLEAARLELNSWNLAMILGYFQMS